MFTVSDDSFSSPLARIDRCSMRSRVNSSDDHVVRHNELGFDGTILLLAGLVQKVLREEENLQSEFQLMFVFE